MASGGDQDSVGRIDVDDSFFRTTLAGTAIGLADVEEQRFRRRRGKLLWTPSEIDDPIATKSPIEGSKMAGHAIGDVAAGYEVDSNTFGKMRLDAVIENAFDNRSTTFKEAGSTLDLAAVGRPRTFGVSLTTSSMIS